MRLNGRVFEAVVAWRERRRRSDLYHSALAVSVPDVEEAIESPRRLTDDPLVARRVLELVPGVPTPVWGRDELGGGEM